MIKVDGSLKDELEEQYFKTELRMDSSLYENDILYKLSQDSSENIEVDIAYVNELENLSDCENFFKTQGGIYFLNRLKEIKQSKIDDFAFARPEELLKVQAEFNAWNTVLEMINNFEQEKNQIQDYIK